MKESVSATLDSSFFRSVDDHLLNVCTSSRKAVVAQMSGEVHFNSSCKSRSGMEKKK
jgi:hypothetical protein